MTIRDDIFSGPTSFNSRSTPTESVALTPDEEGRLARHMHKMFGLKAMDCVGPTPSDTPLDPNFKYPTWLN